MGLSAPPPSWATLQSKPTTIAGFGLTDAANVTQANNAAPVGTVIFISTNSAPSGWIKANGANISRTTYAALFLVIGTTYGAGDGATTFALPDLRGEFLRSLDDGRGVDSGRAIGAAQAHEVSSHSHTTNAYALSPTSGIGTSFGGRDWVNGSSTAFSNSNVGTTGGTETRPRNVAMLACIKF